MARKNWKPGARGAAGPRDAVQAGGRTAPNITEPGEKGERKANRADLRRLRRNAARVASHIASGGFCEPLSGGSGIVRVEAPATGAAITGAVERFLKDGCAPLLERLDHAAALGLPLSATRPPWAERCYIKLTLDRDDRIAWVAIWVAGDSPEEIERACLEAFAEPRLAAWRATPGLSSDFKTRGRA